MQVCKYASKQVYNYASMQVYNNASMQVCSITTLTKSKCQNMRYTNKSEAMYMSAVAAFFFLTEMYGVSTTKEIWI